MSERTHRPKFTEDGRLRIAPSQLKEYQECPRKWAFNHISRLPREYGQGQSDGHAAHELLERYFAHGTPPGEATYYGRLATALLPHVPADSVTEEYVIVDTGSPMWVFHGYIDGYGTGGVWDAKFYAPTSRQWMVTAESLLHDPQAVIYTVAKQHDTFTMHYIIKPRDKDGVPKHEPVQRTFTEDELDAALEELDRLALQMCWIRVHVKDPNTIPHRASSACEGLGVRCPYVAACRLHDPGQPMPWTFGRTQ